MTNPIYRPSPRRWVSRVLYTLFLATAALIVVGHGGPVPVHDIPGQEGPCYSIDYEGPHGMSIMHSATDYGPGWYPYWFATGPPVPSDWPVDPCSTRTSQYWTAAELGSPYSSHLRVVGTMPSESYIGAVAWSMGWQDPTYTAFGWTMLDWDQVFAVWWFVGEPDVAAPWQWNRYGVWPAGAIESGTELYAQAVVTSSAGVTRSSRTWRWVASDEIEEIDE